MKKRMNTNTMIQIAMLAALLAVMSKISFMLPGGIPITLQTFGIFLIGGLLGPINGLITLLVYLFMGLVGIPVFSTFNTGIQAFIQPTGGYIIGFLPMVYLVGLGAKHKLLPQLIYNVLGLLTCHVLGLLMYHYITGVWILPSIPLMLAKDIAIAVIAIFFSRELKTRLSFITST